MTLSPPLTEKPIVVQLDDPTGLSSTRELQFLLLAFSRLFRKGIIRGQWQIRNNLILRGKDGGKSKAPLICPLRFPFLISEQLTLVAHLTSMLAKSGLKMEKSRHQSEGEGA